MRFRKILQTLSSLALISISFASSAETVSIIESKPISEFWINPGAYSYHFQRNKGFNNRNFGLGIDYRYSTVSSVMIGELENSDRYTSHYAVWHWQLLGWGSVRFGAFVGIIDGYPKMLNGGWFPAIIPTVGIAYKNVGMNLLLIPSYQNRLHGAISLQLKFRVF